MLAASFNIGNKDVFVYEANGQLEFVFVNDDKEFQSQPLQITRDEFDQLLQACVLAEEPLK
jgi:hypothetical protein